LIDSGSDLETFLDEWWKAYCKGADGNAEPLNEALVNVQMYVEHRARSIEVGMPFVKMRTYLESIRPHHQYKDIGITERLNFQTLHSLSGTEVEDLVIVLDELSDQGNLDDSQKVLLENARNRATHSLTLIAGDISATCIG